MTNSEWTAQGRSQIFITAQFVALPAKLWRPIKASGALGTKSSA
jgi:hypothetical protein